MFGPTYAPTPSDGTSSIALSHPTGINLQETTVFMMAHAEDASPQIVSTQGNNTMNAALVAEHIVDATNKYFTLQADVGSSLTISTIGSVRQELVGEAYLKLRGAGTGIIDGQIVQPATAWYNGAQVGDGTGTQNIFHLIKEDAGQWTLNNFANQYTGDTFVNGGILSNANPFLADSADVYLKTGGFLDLTFGGQDTIDSLFIDNIPQATGTWGEIGSGADHETALITGMGLLLVSTTSALPGDFNLDGKVDAADYVLWRKDPNAFLPATYDTWRSNFGNPPGAGSGAGLGGGAVPEPATCGLVLCAMIGVLCSRRRAARPRA
jgi:autotransporter-associated beta strand protein